jgi:hypothetical protein
VLHKRSEVKVHLCPSDGAFSECLEITFFLGKSMKITEYSIINFWPYTMVDLTDWC